MLGGVICGSEMPSTMPVGPGVCWGTLHDSGGMSGALSAGRWLVSATTGLMGERGEGAVGSEGVGAAGAGARVTTSSSGFPMSTTGKVT